MNLAHYLGLLHHAESNLAEAFAQVADAHEDEPDVALDCRRMAQQCQAHMEELSPFVDRYGEDADDEPDRLHSDLFQGTRTGALALLRDLHDLYLMTSESDLTWTLIGQAAQGARDRDLLAVVQRCETDTATQLAWLKTRSKQAAPQALVVA
ncbi:MAG: hypothetical protein JWO77_712 [Ilumatobacteraceae bacterium]|nr:hypothetical protein [Ilumatobacteraceae bacterium]